MDRMKTIKFLLFLGLNFISLACSFPFITLIHEPLGDPSEIEPAASPVDDTGQEAGEQTSGPAGLFSYSNQVYRLDLSTLNSSLLHEFDSEFPQHIITDDIRIAFTGEDGLLCMEIETYHETCFVPFLQSESETLSYIPKAWYDPAHIVAIRYQNHLEGGEWKQVKEIGLLNITDHSFRPLPTSDPPLKFDESCQIDLGLSPNLDLLAFTIYSYAEVCEEIPPGVYVIDLGTGLIDPIVNYPGAPIGKIDYGVLDAVWSPDGEELAFTIAEPQRSDPSDEETTLPPWQLIVFDREEGNLYSITDHNAGRVISPVWGIDGSLFYGLVESTQNGIYMQGSGSESPVLILEGYAAPVSVSAAQSYLVYRDEIGISWNLNVLDLITKESRSISLPVEGPPVGIEFIGWVE